MTRKQRRLVLIGSALSVLFVAAGLTMFALRDNIVFFYSPAEIAAKAPAPGTRMRLGGLIKAGSIMKGENRTVTFVVADVEREISVTYTGMLPDLFREGQGVVAEGVLVSPTSFRADSVLAKHDENYMPREVADALKKQGHWQANGAEAKK
ncbi:MULTISPECIES: cytochrome c maturation protein CcmE [unclassified Beijerinckia]|uniref:cytochrome c maturation protein CcmE n=1 Tax=unclassified Beijerinckia TaxID=2638183 RepID=UPI00089972F6|nr:MULTISPECIES: cytochrome c maturation protein CcmE [unclassified Beijerinckia]MDH7796341.1 cytochrome c-type biogenesis protein CcmE [Beijerinckia sp. GAS462]SEC40842.1 cytochrome c-type biogenesis protein CcmE [Beijerinckia sp. 28-YEA-48]